MRKYGLDMSAIALSVCMLLPLLGNTAGDTAFEEVQALTMRYDPTVAGKVYGIRGKHTSPNPASWTLLLKELNLGLDKKRARTLVLFLEEKCSQNERCLCLNLKKGMMGLMPSLDIGTLRIDPGHALQITNVQAAKQQVGLHWVNYRPGRSGGNEVVWKLKLLEHTGTVVGYLLLFSAKDGSILPPPVMELSRHISSRSKNKWITEGGLVGHIRSTALALVHKAPSSTRQIVDRTKVSKGGLQKNGLLEYIEKTRYFPNSLKNRIGSAKC